MELLRKLLLAALLLTAKHVYAQNYSATAIPDSLLADAYAVVRIDSCRIVQKNINNAAATYTYAITLLSAKGKEKGSCYIYQDKFRELRSFSGTVYDKNGKKIKSIAKKDLRSSAYSSSLASDDVSFAYYFYPAQYPVTIEYTYEIQYKYGTPSYPPFFPADSYNLAVEHASYSIEVPLDMKLRFKNQPHTARTAEVGKSKHYKWEVNGLKAIVDEPLSPNLTSLTTCMLVAPSEFCMDGHCGNMDTWESLSAWLASLQINTLSLPEKEVEKVRSIIKDAGTDREKIQLLYQYLQQATRYESIQLGIGGLQPISAEKVAKSGYGDCKGLTNYMKAMLNEVGIPSTYTVISTRYKKQLADFPNLTQTDHVILAVPYKNDTIWLECTSSHLPFGYTPSHITNRDVILVEENGGGLRMVSPTTASTNQPTKTSSLSIIVDEEGDATANMVEHYKLDEYENMLGFTYGMTEEKRVNYITRNANLPKANLISYSTKLKNDHDPEFILSYSLNIERFANKSANRLFVPLTTLQQKLSSGFTKEKRYDIVVKQEGIECDTLYIQLPKGYVVEALPKSCTYKSEFGTYSLEASVVDGKLCLAQYLQIYKTQLPAEKWSEFLAFTKQVEGATSKPAVFTRTD